MLAYLWFCVMLRAVSPGADEIITRYNRAMEAFATAGLIGEAGSISRRDDASSAKDEEEASGAPRGRAAVVRARIEPPAVHRLQRHLRQAVGAAQAWTR